MPVSTRLQAPNYKIFEPDALDQIYAKGNLDPIMGGISYAFGNAHKVDNQIAQGQSLEAGDKFNKLAQALDQMEIESKTKQEAIKAAAHLTGLGESPDLLQGGGDIYTDPTKNLLPGLLRGKIGSEINKNNASAAADRSGGADTVKETYVEPGSNKVVEVTHKGKPGTVAVPSSPSIDPTASTPVPGKTTAVDPRVVQTRAAAAVGPGAKLVETAPNGATLWHNPGTGKVATFDPTGKQVR